MGIVHSTLRDATTPYPERYQQLKMKFTLLILLYFSFSQIYAQDNKTIDSRDGQEYTTISIGNLIWFNENLNFKTENSEYYKNDSLNYSKYGRLYNKSDLTILCPKGWRIPTPNDWKILDSVINKVGIYGIMDTQFWKYDSLLTNISDFSLLPGGYKLSRNKFTFEKISSSLWFNDSTNSKSNYHLHVHHTTELDSSYIFHTHKGVKNRKFYTRCVCENK